MKILFMGADGTHLMEKITVENVTVNGEKITPPVKKNEFTENIIMKG